MNKRITVLIADDAGMTRIGIRGILGSAKDIEVVGEVSNGEQAVQFVAAHQPDIVLMDIDMRPAQWGGIKAASIISASQPHTKIIIVSGHTNYLKEAMSAGAVSYFPKHGEPKELIEAVRRTAQGGTYIHFDLQPDLINQFRRGLRVASQEPLSAREEQVLRTHCRWL